MQDSPFFPSGGRSHSQYLLLPTHGGMAQAESTWVPGSVPGGLPVQMRSNTVTHPGTNRDGRRVTTLIASNALPLRHTDTSRHKSQK